MLRLARKLHNAVAALDGKQGAEDVGQAVGMATAGRGMGGLRGSEELTMTDLPTLWDAVVYRESQDLRRAGELRGQGYLAWSQSMELVDGKLEITDEDLFIQAQDLFAKAREVDMQVG